MFYIKDKVQDVGFRLFVVSKILNSNLEGTALNTSNGRVKVLLEGKKEHIIQFYEQIKNEKPKLAETQVYENIEFDGLVTVPKAMRASQDLMLSQYSKGVNYLAGMKQDLNDIKEGIGTLKEGIGGIQSGLDKLSFEIRSGFNKLPSQIAEAIWR
ncbi:acylphosphatase [archaeon]|nr:acylphosphatase [archaeon]